jgi:peptidoglycan/xylan/chitin deacetylase (PgdA/CDA1 family)
LYRTQLPERWSHDLNRREFLRLMALSTAAAVLPVSGLQLALADDAPFDVYLTFDDGPFPAKDFKTGPTDIVLQTLKDHDALATFFLHGRHILDWHGPVLARYINDGHAVGNHLWSQGGNIVKNRPGPVRLAYQFILTEARIRKVMQGTDEAAYQQYLKQPRLFRRPGGKNGLNDFLSLDPGVERLLQYSPVLERLHDDLDWLKGTYDYSGWHINGGESIPLSIRPLTPDAERQFILKGHKDYYGVMNYLQLGDPPQRSVEADQGLIILMHDYDADTRAMLPQLLVDLKELGAQFKPLPRPIDKPNSFTVGIGYAPTVRKQATGSL